MTAIADDKGEIFRGPATLELDNDSVGIVGDARVTIERMLQEETGEPYGSAPLAQFHEGTRVRVTIPMKQTVAETLAIAIGGDNSSGVVYFEDRPGRATEYNLKLQPVQGKSGAGGIDAVTSRFELYACVAESMPEFAFSRGEERVYEVTFSNVVDPTRSAGKRIGSWVRPVAGA